MNTFSQFFLDLVMPVNCFVCTKKGIFLCPGCSIRLLPAPPSIHPYIYARFNYKDKRVRDLLWQYKYTRKKILAPILARSLVEDLAILSVLERAEALIPIPTTKKSARFRGFDQTRVLASELSTILPHLSITKSSVLVKNKKSKEQTKTKNRKERWQNASLSFVVVNSEPILGKHLVVIDDVTTTGATLHYARLALLGAGAKTVHCIAVARLGR
jgi:ComF family protein